MAPKSTAFRFCGGVSSQRHPILLRSSAVHRQRDLGGLHFGSLRKNAYSREDIEFMQHVARQVAVAVDNALNHEAAQAYEEQLARERDRLRTLLEVNNAVVSLPLQQAASSKPSPRHCAATSGWITPSLLIHDPEMGALRLQCSTSRMERAPYAWMRWFA